MHNTIKIAATLLIAIMLAFLPMPDWANWFRPAWVLLVLMYWTIMTPYIVGVGVAWFFGIVLDLLNGTMLGEHALALSVVIYFVARIHIRLRMAPMMQQGISIMFFVLLYQFILYCIQGFIGELPTSYLYWLSSVTSMLFWPWLFVLLRDYRRRFNV